MTNGDGDIHSKPSIQLNGFPLFFFFTMYYKVNSYACIYQFTGQGALTIVRRSSQKKSTYSEEYSMALSRENESMLDEVDLSLEGMPSFDSSEAVDKAALR